MVIICTLAAWRALIRLGVAFSVTVVALGCVAVDMSVSLTAIGESFLNDPLKVSLARAFTALIYVASVPSAVWRSLVVLLTGRGRANVVALRVVWLQITGVSH
jgi:hypothetical protein